MGYDEYHYYKSAHSRFLRRVMLIYGWGDSAACLVVCISLEQSLVEWGLCMSYARDSAL